MHRYCTGVSVEHYKSLDQSPLPFNCAHFVYRESRLLKLKNYNLQLQCWLTLMLHGTGDISEAWDNWKQACLSVTLMLHGTGDISEAWDNWKQACLSVMDQCSNLPSINVELTRSMRARNLESKEEQQSQSLV